MIFVVELLPDGRPNVFRSAANMLTHDDPATHRAVQVFFSEAEAKQAHQQGAGIFSGFGPDGYRAFVAFEKFLQESAVIPAPPSPGRGARPRVKKKRTPFG